jgi:osmotically-inducible protein OsmY
MICISTRRVLVLAAFALSLAACDGSQGPAAAVDPVVAQQLVATRADPDKALADKVKKALGIDEGAAYGVEVSATDGTVTLWGQVDSSAERRRVATIAAGVVGVRTLINNVTLDPGA